MDQDDKYVVFKAEDIWKFAYEISNDESTVEDIKKGVEAWRVDDAVVIRRQDVFAAPALDTYANSILAAVEVLKETTSRGTIAKPSFSPEMYGIIRRLQGVADYFYNQAKESWDTNRKIPD